MKLINRENISEQLLIDTAVKLKVNMQTLLISLKSLKLINQTQYYNFLKTRIPKKYKEDPELTGLSDKIKDAKKNLLEKGLSSFYIKSCYEAYSSGHISAKRLAEMFLTDEIELPNILNLFKLQLKHDN